ncbi:DUF2959 family protein [Pseudomonas matsuisoli]|uniref:DUF2959 domain-containing protein n=1 Tax=Pseudomonas matsuisoli TaxID=1515666 RepID=A0A917URC5_9PSED|nr:DUF2959 family protein [Pseudomonas matsuisoli]GGJ79095.1 hypothetical protein GCM10009304_01220 [Pseudomonas matsuisoli]
MRVFPYGCLLICLAVLSGCKSVYYDALERTGVSKQDLFVDRLEDTRKAQTNAQEQLERTIRSYRSLALFRAGNLPSRLEQLKGDYRTSDLRARNIRYHRQGVENVADDMFDEWEDTSSSNATLKPVRTRDIERMRDEYDDLHANLLKVDNRLSTLLGLLEEQISVLEQRPAPIPKDLSSAVAGIDARLREVETYIQRSNDQIDRLVGTLRD